EGLPLADEFQKILHAQAAVQIQGQLVVAILQEEESRESALLAPRGEARGPVSRLLQDLQVLLDESPAGPAQDQTQAGDTRKEVEGLQRPPAPREPARLLLRLQEAEEAVDIQAPEAEVVGRGQAGKDFLPQTPGAQ